MIAAKPTWHKLLGRSCDTCEFADTFRSNGDGQVTRLHIFCRGPQSPHYNRPAPEERWCPAWQKRREARRPPQVGDPHLTA